jgi:5-methylcytosine-specific restriction endonuclease McrA
MATTYRRASSAEKLQAEVMAACGLSYIAMSKALGSSPTTIKLWLRPDAKQKAQENAKKWNTLNPSRRAAIRAKSNAKRVAQDYEDSLIKSYKKRAATECDKAILPYESVRSRFKLFAFSCAYCGSRRDLQADHVHPVSLGGLHEPLNIVPACRQCNCSKRKSPVAEWYKRQPFFLEADWQRIQQHCPHVAEAVA